MKVCGIHLTSKYVLEVIRNASNRSRRFHSKELN